MIHSEEFSLESPNLEIQSFMYGKFILKKLILISHLSKDSFEVICIKFLNFIRNSESRNPVFPLIHLWKISSEKINLNILSFQGFIRSNLHQIHTLKMWYYPDQGSRSWTESDLRFLFWVIPSIKTNPLQELITGSFGDQIIVPSSFLLVLNTDRSTFHRSVEWERRSRTTSGWRPRVFIFRSTPRSQQAPDFSFLRGGPEGVSLCFYSVGHGTVCHFLNELMLEKTFFQT